MYIYIYKNIIHTHSHQAMREKDPVTHAVDSKGAEMLMKMGWSAGEGLGALFFSLFHVSFPHSSHSLHSFFRVCVCTSVFAFVYIHVQYRYIIYYERTYIIYYERMSAEVSLTRSLARSLALTLSYVYIYIYIM